MKTIQIGSERYFCCGSPSSSSREKQKQKVSPIGQDTSLHDLKAFLADGCVGPTVGQVQILRSNDVNPNQDSTHDGSPDPAQVGATDAENEEDDHINNTTIDLDPIGFGGDYVEELLMARPVLVPSSSLTKSPSSQTLQETSTSTSTTTKEKSPSARLSFWKSLRRQLDTQGILVWPNATVGEANDKEETASGVANARNMDFDDDEMLPDLEALESSLWKKRASLFGSDSGQSTQVRSDRVFFVSSWPKRSDDGGDLIEYEDDSGEDDEDEAGKGPSSSLCHANKSETSTSDIKEQLRNTLQWMEGVVSKILDTGGGKEGDSCCSTSSVLEEHPELSNSVHAVDYCKWEKSYTVWRPALGMCSLYKSSDQAHYTWHYDNEVDENTGRWRNFRVLTAILYLNHLSHGTGERKEWRKEDGGHLECQVSSSPGEGQCTTATMTVPPSGGTLVIFDSRKVRHRVLAAHRDRFALTQWFVSPQFSTDDETAPRGYRLLCNKRKKADDQQTKVKTRPYPQQSSNENEERKTKQPDSFCHWPGGNSSPTAHVNEKGSATEEKSTKYETGTSGFNFNFL